MEESIEIESHPDFAVIWSFFQKFGKQLDLEDVLFTDVISWFSNAVSPSSSLVEMMMKLMRKTGMRVDKQRWQRHLIKAAMKFDYDLGTEIQTSGFNSLSVARKMYLLKLLCEMQFDDNIKFKSVINTEEAADQRLKPVGRDEEGLLYWHQEDEDMNIRLYIEEEDEDDDIGWKVVCRSQGDIENLIRNLKDEPADKSKEENSDEEEDIVETKFQKFLKSQCTTEGHDESLSEKTIKKEPKDSIELDLKKENSLHELPLKEEKDTPESNVDSITLLKSEPAQNTEVQSNNDQCVKEELRTISDIAEIKSNSKTDLISENMECSPESSTASKTLNNKLTIPSPIKSDAEITTLEKHVNCTIAPQSVSVITSTKSISDCDNGVKDSDIVSECENSAVAKLSKNDDSGGCEQRNLKREGENKKGEELDVNCKNIDETTNNTMQSSSDKSGATSITNNDSISKIDTDQSKVDIIDVHVSKVKNGQCANSDKTLNIQKEIEEKTNADVSSKENVITANLLTNCDVKDLQTPVNEKETEDDQKEKNEIQIKEEQKGDDAENTKTFEKESQIDKTENEQEVRHQEEDSRDAKLVEEKREDPVVQSNVLEKENKKEEKNEEKGLEEKANCLKKEDSDLEKKQVGSEKENKSLCEKTDVVKIEITNVTEKTDGVEKVNESTPEKTQAEKQDNKDFEGEPPMRNEVENDSKDSVNLKTINKAQNDDPEEIEKRNKDTVKTPDDAENENKELKVKPDALVNDNANPKGNSQEKDLEADHEDVKEKGDLEEKTPVVENDNANLTLNPEDIKEDQKEKMDLEENSDEIGRVNQNLDAKSNDEEKEEKNLLEKPDEVEKDDKDVENESNDEEKENKEELENTSTQKPTHKRKPRRKKRKRASTTKKRSQSTPRKPSERSHQSKQKKPKLSRLEQLQEEADSILHVGEKKSGDGEAAYRTRSGRRVKNAKKDEPEVWQTFEDDDYKKHKRKDSEADDDFLYSERKKGSHGRSPMKEQPKKEIQRIVNDDTPCMKCGLYSHPETILLCDGCDKGHHMACLTPPLMIVPYEEWFCPKCSQLKLIDRLKEIYEEHENKLKIHQKKTKQIERKKILNEYTGISETNIIKEEPKPPKPRPPPKKRRTYSSDESESDELDYSSPSSPELKTTRRCRTKVSYDFSSFDKTIMDAIGDDIDKKPEGADDRPISGKDIRTIIAAEKGGEADFDESKDDFLPGKRKKRKLTNLNSSDEEVVESGSNYSVSESEDEASEEDYKDESNSSGSEDGVGKGWRSKRSKKPYVKPVKRSKRLRRKRIQEDYETSLSESSEYEEELPKKSAKKKKKSNGYGRESTEDEYVPPKQIKKDRHFIDDDEEDDKEKDKKETRKSRAIDSSSDENQDKKDEGENQRGVKPSDSKVSNRKQSADVSSDDWSSLSSNAAKSSDEEASEDESTKNVAPTANDAKNEV